MSQQSKESAGDRRTVIEEGTEFRGVMVSKRPVLLRGMLDGELQAPNVVVEAGGELRGKARLGELKSEGQVSGDIHADRVKLAGVVGDGTRIVARVLEIDVKSQDQAVAVTFSRATLEIGDATERESSTTPPPPPASD